jgi:hypothetical protein
MRIITLSSLKRLAAVGLLLLILLFVAWFSMIRMPLESYRGPLPPLSEDERVLAEMLERDVQTLAGEIGERNVFIPAKLEAAVEFIESEFASAGYEVRRHAYQVKGETCYNLEIELSGTARPSEIVIVGAHYDSAHGSPGANDNGTGTAALLALARSFSAQTAGRTLRFVAFVNEEPPFFQTSEMGSLVYARFCRERGDNVVAMISLETIGYYQEQAGSQKYPPGVGWFYPGTGNFIAFVGNVASRQLVRESIESFRRHAQFPSEGAALPSVLPGIGWSDHWAFWQAGYPAIMITDTAPFRYPHYHSASDTPDKIDYERMARVVAGVRQLIFELVNPG